MIITIGRQHGSNGHLIAEALAAKLQIPCFSKEIVDRAVRDTNFSREVIRSYDEKRISPFVAPTLHFYGMDEGFRLNMKIASAQFDAIRSLAAEGDAIFVGRCADYVLRSRDDLVRVFIMADMPYRVQTIMERKSLTEDQARRLIREVDKDRSSYYRYYTDQTWGDSGSYDLCVNMTRIGIDGAVNTICAFAKSL